MDDTGRIDGTAYPLRDLFVSVGPDQAPAGLDAAVLARIQQVRVPAQRTNTPLIPAWAWIAGSLFCIGTLLLSRTAPLTWSIPALPALRMTGSTPWLLGALGCATVLFGLDALLKIRAVRVSVR